MYILNAQSVPQSGRFAQGNAEETTDDSALANSLPSILTLSRFVHYVCCLCRSRIGSFSTHLAIEQFIKEKLTEYVAPFNPALNSMYPLAAVVVSIADGLDPGYVDARISLRPKLMTQTLNHDITSQIRLSYLLWGSR